MTFIPEQILSNSIFIYLQCPYEERLKRNLDRNGWQTNPAVFERLTKEDDFEEWSKTLTRPLIVYDTLNNKFVG
jgi:hypothetical protein